MSAQDATRLLADLKTNPTLRAQLAAAGNAGFEAAARAAGYNVTPAEFAAAVNNSVTANNLRSASWAEAILIDSPRIIGFTTTFQQNVASLALAKEIRRHAPAYSS